MTMASAQWLTIVGLGEEGINGLPPVALDAIQNAEVLVGGYRHLSKVKDAKAKKCSWGKNLESGIDAVSENIGRRVVVLASGDPMHFGIGSRLVQRFGIETMTIIPAPSAFSLAAARLGWSTPEVECITVHGRPLEAVNLYLYPNAKLLILSWDGTTPAKLARLLVAKGYPDSQITTFEHMGGKKERIVKNIAAEWKSQKLSALNTISVECLAGPNATVWSRVPGLPESAFQHDNMITKYEVRAATIAALSPLPNEFFWDVGAGSGAIAIEWLRLVPSARAIAIESKKTRFNFIRANARNLGVPNLEIVAGRAPDVFKKIQGNPNSIFVGGGVSDINLMLACWNRLQLHGKLVANAVTLQTQEALLKLREKWGGKITKFSIARESPIGRFSSLQPLMEVWQLRAEKK
tara:strand:- start:1176 stop:2396 length:1221 start_codon:yes stop_codon:yes gene_type:complete